MSSTRERSTFRTGDWVTIPLGGREVSGVIVEDRGAIGVGGRRLFHVSVPMDPDEPEIFLMPEDDLKREENSGKERVPPAKSRIIEYLANGGLVAILLSNSPGGKNQARVWLCLNNLGNVTHTFTAERGLVGGEVVPLGTLNENLRLFTPKVREVAEFLTSFGLTSDEADQVIRMVGTSA